MPNMVGLINCLRQPGQLYYRIRKSMVLNLFQLIKSCCTRTDPAAKTKSIGLHRLRIAPSASLWRPMVAATGAYVPASGNTTSLYCRAVVFNC
jgi:hypothetical protein